MYKTQVCAIGYWGYIKKKNVNLFEIKVEVLRKVQSQKYILRKKSKSYFEKVKILRLQLLFKDKVPRLLHPLHALCRVCEIVLQNQF